MDGVKTAADVLQFWFSEVSGDDWFQGSAGFDASLTDKFAATHAAVARGDAWEWRRSGEGRLAEIIVLDQFSRNMFRGSPKAFAQDAMALTLAQELVAGGHHNFLGMPRVMFALMPYQHSESPVVQEESLRLHKAYASPDLLKFAEGHAACIARFGRFPKRNAALGRNSSEEELQYIATAPGPF